MNYIKGYQINANGDCDGLTIPSGFGIAITAAFYQNSDDGISNYYLVVLAYTALDTTFTTSQLPANTDLVNQNWQDNGLQQTYPITAGDLASAVQTLVNNKVKPDLEAAYGAANVVEL